jgi:thymidylate synthase (FAD)
LFHFLELRLASAAQFEIRAYAQVIADVVAAWCPLAYGAFVDYRRDAIQLSRAEQRIIRALSSSAADAMQAAAEEGLLNRGADGKLIRSREREELEAKLEVLALAVPWSHA